MFKVLITTTYAMGGLNAKAASVHTVIAEFTNAREALECVDRVNTTRCKSSVTVRDALFLNPCLMNKD